MEYYVSKPTSFMHLCPDAKSEVTDELLYGTAVTVEDESYAGYVYAVTDYGYGGYVDRDALSHGKETGQEYIVTSRFCDLYLYPEYRFMPVITLPRGSVLTGTEVQSADERFRGICTGGKTYFAPRHCLRKKTQLFGFDGADSKRERILKNAFSYLGTPYRWGGKSTFGIDCSGLCFMSYYLAGLMLYRDAEPDARYVKKIRFEELKPADLIYYNGHVTMYIGLGEYIHSSATLGGVRTGSFDENSREYYPKLRSDIVCCARSLYLS